MKGNDLLRDKPIKNTSKLSLKLVLPLPPSVNHMYHHLMRGGKRLTKRSEDYIRTSRAIINEMIEEQMWTTQPKSTWYYVDMVFFMPDKRIRDSHNMLKLLLDVMQGIIFDNDYYVMPRIHSVEYDKENPRVELIVSLQTAKHRENALKKICYHSTMSE